MQLLARLWQFCKGTPLSRFKNRKEKNYAEDNPTCTPLPVETFQLGNPPVKSKSSNIKFRQEKTNVNSLETFIELVKKDLFQPCNYNKIKSNITKEERNGLKNIQHDQLGPVLQS